jgi:tetratricopeptide (TPR) repeat protein
MLTIDYFHFDILHKTNVVFIMLTRMHRKWKYALVLLAAVSLVVFSFMTASCSRSDSPQNEQREAARSSAPMIEQNATKVLSVEELDVDSSDPQALAILADKYFKLKNYLQAAELYEKVIEVNPQDVSSYNSLGLVYYYTKRASLALDTLRKGTKVDPSFQNIWLTLGFVLMATGQIEEAKAPLSKAIELNPVNNVGQEAQKMLSSIQ